MATLTRYWDAVFAFLAAAAVAVLLTPLAGKAARRVGAISYPTVRGLSRREVPLLGGLAILAGFLVAAIFWIPDSFNLRPAPHSGTVVGVVHKWPLIAGAVLIAAVGAIDDIWDLKPILKLAGQIAAAIVAVRAGATINDLTLPFIGAHQFTDAGGPLAVIWLVVLMNVVNLSDGVDGLAAGVCTIDGITFTVIVFNIQGGTSAAAVLAAITAGASLGFLAHNFYPAKIFMGDTGANLLGYLLGVTAIIGTLKTNAVLALVGPLLILAVPFMDTGFVVAKRLKYGKKPWDADDNHFHHRMARIGFSQRKTVIYLYAWTLMLSGVALALRFVPYSDHHGHYHLGWAIVMGVILLVGAAASVYLVYVLEILKFRSARTTQLRRVHPQASDQEIEQTVKRDVATGEFDALDEESPGAAQGEPSEAGGGVS